MPDPDEEAIITEIFEAYEALEDTDNLDWSSFESLLDKAIAAGVMGVYDGDSEFQVFKRAPPLSVLEKQLKVVPIYASYNDHAGVNALHQVLEHIGENVDSEYTLEHLKLLYEAYPEGLGEEHVYGEGEHYQATFSTLTLLFRNRWTSFIVDHFDKVLSCAKWLVEKSPELFWFEASGESAGTNSWGEVCAFIERAIGQLHQEQNSDTTDEESVKKVMLEKFGSIFKVYCKEMCINNEVALLQVGDHAPNLLGYLLTKNILLDDHGKPCALSFEKILGSSHFGENLDFWKILAASQPECLRKRCSSGLYLFAVAAAENRALDVILYLLLADPGVLDIFHPGPVSAKRKREHNEQN